jgi:ABC-type amino acid transport substrate-binding protein
MLALVAVAVGGLGLVWRALQALLQQVERVEFAAPEWHRLLALPLPMLLALVAVASSPMGGQVTGVVVAVAAAVKQRRRGLMGAHQFIPLLAVAVAAEFQRRIPEYLLRAAWAE